MSTGFLHYVTSEEAAGPHLIMLNLLFKQKKNFISIGCFHSVFILLQIQEHSSCEQCFPTLTKCLINSFYS